METGFYNLSAGMKSEEMRLKTTANNIANINTAGFKKQHSYFREMLASEADRFGDKTRYRAAGSYTDFRQGALKHTGDKRHLALEGGGFFTLQGPAGRLYTRNGIVAQNSEGVLVNEDGLPLLGEDGAITVGAGEFTVIDTGNVLDGQGNIIDRLLIADFENLKAVIPAGGSFFENAAGDGNLKESPGFRVMQGYIETPNVSIVEEMVSLTVLARTYEAMQRTLQVYDMLYGKLVDTVRS